MSSAFSMFIEPEALRINRARQEHLASLGIELHGKSVLEVGAGIGLHTAFFEERGCDVLSTDGNPANVAEMLRLYPHRKLGVLDLDRVVELADLGSFDIVYCYGTLYHLRDPDGALARLARVCTGQILVETLVVPGSYPELHRVVEPLSANQGIRGIRDAADPQLGNVRTAPALWPCLRHSRSTGFSRFRDRLADDRSRRKFARGLCRFEIPDSVAGAHRYAARPAS